MAYEKKTQTQRERSDCVAHAVHLKPLQSCMSIISQEKKKIHISLGFHSILIPDSHLYHMVDGVLGGLLRGHRKYLNTDGLSGSSVQLLLAYFKLVLFSCAQLKGLIYYLVLTKLPFTKDMWLNKVPQRNYSLKITLTMKAQENSELFGSHLTG